MRTVKPRVFRRSSSLLSGIGNIGVKEGFICSAVGQQDVLGGSWVVKSEVISPLTWVISIVTLLITLLITTHEPPSSQLQEQEPAVRPPRRRARPRARKLPGGGSLVRSASFMQMRVAENYGS